MKSLSKDRGMIAGPPRRFGHDAEAKFGEIEVRNECIDCADGFISSTYLSRLAGKILICVRFASAMNRCMPGLPPIHLLNHSVEGVFTQPGSEADTRRLTRQADLQFAKAAPTSDRASNSCGVSLKGLSAAGSTTSRWPTGTLRLYRAN